MYCKQRNLRLCKFQCFKLSFFILQLCRGEFKTGLNSLQVKRGEKNTIQYQLLIKRLISLSKKTVSFFPQTCLIEMNNDIYAWFVIPILMILHHRNSIIQYHMIQYHMLLYDTVWFDAISHDMTWYCMIWYNIVS